MSISPWCCVCFPKGRVRFVVFGWQKGRVGFLLGGGGSRDADDAASHVHSLSSEESSRLGLQFHVSRSLVGRALW